MSVGGSQHDIVEVFFLVLDDTSKVVDISSLQQEEAKGGGIA